MNYLFRIFSISLLASSFLQAQPKLSLDKLDIDFGSVYAGTKKQGHVQLQNIGNDTLRIISIEPSCGCTTIKRPKDFLPPGASDVVEIEFNSSGYHAGKAEKYVRIMTNDPASPNVSVKFHVLIKELLEATEHNFWLGEIPLNQPTTKTLTVKNVSGAPLTIKNIICSTPNLQAKASAMALKDSALMDVQLTFTAVKSGYGVEYVWLETDNHNQPRIEFRVPFIGKETKP
jgi:hypothetical protein